MIRLIACVLLFVAVPQMAVGAEAKVPLDPVNINLSKTKSLQRGARLFVNFCLSCHSASYMRYNRMAEDLGISRDELENNLMFAGDKPGDLMKTTMPPDDAKEWFGVAPPDLTLIARLRKPEWIYTFLRSFYLDEKSPSGWNNTLFENVAMPHILYELQGSQQLVDPGSKLDRPTFKTVKTGTMSPAEYDRAMTDLTRFLVYLGEPIKLKRNFIGVFVMLFLAVLLVLTYLLKKEYWKDVH